ncbi:hypothetical protein MKW98_007226, partial [Papaver atlanticum]
MELRVKKSLISFEFRRMRSKPGVRFCLEDRWGEDNIRKDVTEVGLGAELVELRKDSLQLHYQDKRVSISL